MAQPVSNSPGDIDEKLFLRLFYLLFKEGVLFKILNVGPHIMAAKTMLDITAFLDILYIVAFLVLICKNQCKDMQMQNDGPCFKINGHYPDVCHFAAAVSPQVKQNVPALAVVN